MSDVWADFWGHLTGVMIVVIMFTFICIWAWAWSGRHKKPFTRMAQLPMEDDMAPYSAAQKACAKDQQS
jgi:cytochrome c oxidase cbb3-type subunit 4